MVDRQQHWTRVYGSKREDEVSWFESFPAVSLRLMDASGLTAHTCVLDVGGGDSRLIDALVARGLTCLAVLDVSDVPLQRARSRLGERANMVTWIVSDVTADWSVKPMDIWHDRAVFHFLTEATDRARYIGRLHDTLKPGGTAIIATFALDGPDRCSGLPAVRYSPETLAAELGDAFRLVDAVHHLHTTPSGVMQSFQYSRLARVR